MAIERILDTNIANLPSKTIICIPSQCTHISLIPTATSTRTIIIILTFFIQLLFIFIGFPHLSPLQEDPRFFEIIANQLPLLLSINNIRVFVRQCFVAVVFALLAIDH
jgi:hypothetical protein